MKVFKVSINDYDYVAAESIQEAMRVVNTTEDLMFRFCSAPGGPSFEIVNVENMPDDAEEILPLRYRDDYEYDCNEYTVKDIVTGVYDMTRIIEK